MIVLTKIKQHTVRTRHPKPTIMRYLIYIVAIATLTGCSAQSDPEPSQKSYNKKVDSHPGMKGVMIGSSIEEVKPRLKRINPISGLKLDETTKLSEKYAVSFSLADSLQKVGEYKLGRITGRAYRDTIYTIKARVNDETNVIGIRQVLEEIYGQPTKHLGGDTVFNSIWSGKEVSIYYDSYLIDDELSAVLKIQNQSMAYDLFEQPDPVEHDNAADF